MTDKPAVRPDVAVGDALQAVARDILAEARAAVDDRTKSDAIAVHDFRKAMKRWRALLRLLQPFLGEYGERLRIAARDLARELASARDARAAVEAIDDLSESGHALSSHSMQIIRARIDDIGKNTEGAALTDDLRGRLAAALDTANATIGLWPVERISFSDLAAELTEHYRRVRKALPQDWRTADAEALHVLRQRVVAHRYQMELVEPLWPRMGRLWVDEAQRLRDRLGAHQDLAVLVRFTAPHQPLAPWRSRLTPLIAARQAEHAKAAARMAGRLFAERPKAFRQRLEALWESREKT